MSCFVLFRTFFLDSSLFLCQGSRLACS